MTSTTVASRPAAETHPTRAPFPEVSTTSPPGPAAATVIISADSAYRYALTRRWGSGPTALFVGLNPSTADAASDDASTRRMVGFARSVGCGGLTLVNLYAWRSRSPSVLRKVSDPVGPDNDAWITRAAAASDLVVAAWGTHARPERSAAVLELLRCSTIWCLGLTRDRHPAHPLYLPSRTSLQIFQPATHDWSEWAAVHESGLSEPLRERACVACGVDEVDVDPGDLERAGRWS